MAIGSFVGFYGVDQTKAIILDKIAQLTRSKNQKPDGGDDEVI